MPRRPDRFLVLGALLIAGQLGVRAWALSGSWFYFDDRAFMSRAMNQPFDADYLLESYGGHLMPAGFAVVRLLTDWAAYEWWPWALTLLVLDLTDNVVDGAVVELDMRHPGLGFGAGPHACPGRAHAIALAAGIIEGSA